MIVCSTVVKKYKGSLVMASFLCAAAGCVSRHRFGGRRRRKKVLLAPVA
jgi:hypothetical protein